MISCSFCGSDSEYEIMVYLLRGQGTKFSSISRVGEFAHLYLCTSCLPFSKILEVTTKEVIEKRTIRPVK